MNDEPIELLENYAHGVDRSRGNLLGIQPYMRRGDYASQDAFTGRLRAYFIQAQQQGWLNARTVVVLPEHLGTWLVTAGERPAVAAAGTIQTAAGWIIMGHLLPFLRAVLRAREPDRLSAALFRLKAAQMAQIYTAAFARLAREFGVSIAAGSIVLPEPRVSGGQVTAGQGPLYNTAFLFHPDGRADSQIVRKIYPIDSELPFTAPGALADLPVFETPAGRLGILVCADSWQPQPYAQLAAQGAELIAVPSASAHGEMWERPWQGYNGAAAPPDVDPADVGRLTERQAWGRYALAGRTSSARAGINVFLYGDLWDLDFSGGLWRMVSSGANIEGSRYGPALVNLWL